MSIELCPNLNSFFPKNEADRELVSRTVDDQFIYKPWDEPQRITGKLVTETLAEAAKVIISVVPPSADRSAALRKLREARMDCNSAITHKGRY